jgi:hypothetical protein
MEQAAPVAVTTGSDEPPVELELEYGAPPVVGRVKDAANVASACARPVHPITK